MEFISQRCLLAVVLHYLLINLYFHSFNCLYIILDIISNGQKLLYFQLERLPELSNLQLQGGAMVQDSVIAHIFLYLEDILQLLEVVSRLSEQIGEVLFRIH